MPQVELVLTPLPAHVRTARLVGVAAARRAGLDDSLLDELRLALGEACTRAVALHLQHGVLTPVRVVVQDDPGRLTVSVTDSGPAAGPVPQDPTGHLLDGGDDDLGQPEVALAVLSGLVDDAEVTPLPVGTTVTMRWPLPVRLAGVASV